MGVADRKSDKLDQVLSDAVKGRYEEGGLQVNSSIFTAIVEAYPKLDGLNVYDNIVNYIAACREGYRSTQDKLLDQVRRYKTWLKQDLFRQLVVEKLGFPSDSLEARIGTNVVYGKEALKKMQQIVLVSDAKEAYETGEMEPLSPERKK